MYKLSFLLTGLSLLLIACSPKEPVRIGYIGSITGKNSDLGVAARDAAILAVESVNTSGGINGRKIELIDKDDAQNPDTAARVAQELIGSKVVAIVGPLASSMTKASLPVINNAKVVMISPTASSNELSGRDDFFFRVMEPNTLFAKHQAETCRKLKIKRVAAIYDIQNKTYTVEMFNTFKDEFVRQGGIVASEIRFDSQSSPSFSRLVAQLDLKSAGAVMVLANTIDSLNIAQQIRKVNPEITILSGACGIAQRDLLEQAGKSIDNIIFTLPVNSRSETAAYRQFSADFKNRFHYEPTFAATLAYDAMQLIFTALRKNPDSARLRDTIKGIESFTGLQGEVKLDRYGDPSRNLFVTRYLKGHEEVIK
ncbi:ABC transporter substrate-binding protein [Geobacter pelophilus]|uniref:ABC transporter substrate-binding protein n=1 Tax=Geoanaerobacter pelophilus TaxID=60036 RepID=A0AAW4L3C4_9BACT|nr:ABC transporter substrate-binding protein [Geoanaerobacter pelophilus]MBT0665383.1 ABC transporter substrate-binding protein [Geoanaerobacter pelophilus]